MQSMDNRISFIETAVLFRYSVFS